MSFLPEQWRNRLLPVASGSGLENVVSFHTDATIYRGQLEAGNSTTLASLSDRRIFVYLTKGELKINDLVVCENDQARIDSVKPLRIQASSDSEFVLVDVPSCKGWGYSEKTLRGASE